MVRFNTIEAADAYYAAKYRSFRDEWMRLARHAKPDLRQTCVDYARAAHRSLMNWLARTREAA